jgi:hypothetical protein
MTNMEVRYVNHGIANNFGSYIEMHEGLKAYPKLHAYVLKHELEHTDKPGFTKHDFMHDIAQAEYNIKDIISFMVHNPSSLKQLLPFYKQGDTIIYDLNLIIIYSLILGAVGVALYFGFTL